MERRGSLHRLLMRTNCQRVLFFLAVDVLLLAVSMYVAFLLRFEGQIPLKFTEDLWILILIALGLKIPIFYLQGLYRISWSYVSVQELLSVFKGVL